MHTVSLYLEFLAFNGLAHASIVNHVCGVKFYLRWFDISVEAFESHRVKLMLKALSKTVVSHCKQKGIFHVKTLTNIVLLTRLHPYSEVYTVLYLFAFFGFFRISNLVPVSTLKFEVKKHLCVGDVLVFPTHLVVLIKWPKTIQSSQNATYIILPKLRDPTICPWIAFNNLKPLLPNSPNAPLFAINQLPCTELMVRSHLKKILTTLGLDLATHSFHTFRRSGATLAFNLGVDMCNIKRHGTWRSDSVYKYIVTDPTHASGVATTFQCNL